MEARRAVHISSCAILIATSFSVANQVAATVEGGAEVRAGSVAAVGSVAVPLQAESAQRRIAALKLSIL